MAPYHLRGLQGRQRQLETHIFLAVESKREGRLLSPSAWRPVALHPIEFVSWVLGFAVGRRGVRYTRLALFKFPSGLLDLNERETIEGSLYALYFSLRLGYPSRE